MREGLRASGGKQGPGHGANRRPDPATARGDVPDLARVGNLDDRFAATRFFQDSGLRPRSLHEKRLRSERWRNGGRVGG